TVERTAALRTRRFSFCRFRFIADLMLAIRSPPPLEIRASRPRGSTRWPTARLRSVPCPVGTVKVGDPDERRPPDRKRRRGVPPRAAGVWLTRRGTRGGRGQLGHHGEPDLRLPARPSGGANLRSRRRHRRVLRRVPAAESPPAPGRRGRALVGLRAG